MEYELYIDVLFLVNFMMDYLVLQIVRKITKCATSPFRIVISSMIGAILTCIVIAMSVNSILLNTIIFHGFISIIMIKVGFKTPNKHSFFQCLITLYCGSFLFGGVFGFFQQYMKVTSLFFCVAVGSYYVVKGVWWFFRNVSLQRATWYEVSIYFGKEDISVRALYDTGNSLREPYLGRPVSILERRSEERILDRELEKGYYEIPYHSIGHDGVLKVVKATKMHITGDVDIWVQNPIIAISDEVISVEDQYQMILSPEIF